MASNLSSSSQHDSTQAAPPAQVNSTWLPVELVIPIAQYAAAGPKLQDSPRQTFRRNVGRLRLVCRQVFISLHRDPTCAVEDLVDVVVRKLLSASLGDDAEHAIRTSLTLRHAFHTTLDVAFDIETARRLKERVPHLLSPSSNLRGLTLRGWLSSMASTLELGRLRALHIQFGRDNRTLPNLSSLESLRYLYLDCSEARKKIAIPPSFAWPPGLKHLALLYTPQTEQEDLRLWQCTHLETLRVLSPAPFFSEDPVTPICQRLDLPLKASLSALVLRNQGLNDLDLAALQIHLVPSLEKLCLTGNELTNLEPLQLGKLPRLVRLDLSYNWLGSLSGLDLDALSSLRALRLDYMRGMRQWRTDLGRMSDALASHGALERLSLRDGQIRDRDLADFKVGRSQTLKLLDLTWTSIEVGLEALELDSSASLRLIRLGGGTMKREEAAKVVPASMELEWNGTILPSEKWATELQMESYLYEP